VIESNGKLKNLLRRPLDCLGKKRGQDRGAADFKKSDVEGKDEAGGAEYG
jgi:hypothetical protein